MFDPVRIPATQLADGMARFSELIDVRTPAEFADDAVAGAVNLPVLDDAERARIGTIYSRDSRFRARREGAAIIARNAAGFLDGHLADKGGGYFPLLYCWRGGLRSQGLATIMASVGWRVAILDGGYKAYRAEIVRWFAEEFPAIRWRFVVVAGLTGSGKTAVLRQLAAEGDQVLDLERLANHRGSTLGAEPDSAQPGQRRFEGALWAALRAFDPARPVLVESESHRIGALQIPAPLWRELRAAPVVDLRVPVEARRDLLLREYPHFLGDAESLVANLGRLRHLHGGAAVDAWCALARAGDWPALVESLLRDHYDPAYRRSTAKNFREKRATVAAETVDEAALPALAARVRESALATTPAGARRE